MKILTVDIGTGTQDIFLYDSRLDLENGYKLVLPSPTMIVSRRLQEATRHGQAVLLYGETMGGGPSQWAAQAHAHAGLNIYATPNAARSFNDDLEAVQAMGIHVINEEAAEELPPAVLRLEMGDLDFPLIAHTLEGFGVSLEGLEAVAVAVFDHGNAPPGISDRKFRFDYLDKRIRARNRLSDFAFRSTQIPSTMTRLRAVAHSTRRHTGRRLRGVPLVVMDTAPAAILGATFDPLVSQRQRVMIINIGNLHTLAFRLGPSGIEGVFEHHTGLLDQPKLEMLLRALADGNLTNAEVFDHHGHGALLYEPTPLLLDQNSVVVTGPRRSLLHGSALHPYFAVPFGDMMLSGCFGLLAATADLLPELREPIQASLNGAGSDRHPWDIE